jgi:peptidoglycan hydrolase CwlO-like protein
MKKLFFFVTTLALLISLVLPNIPATRAEESCKTDIECEQKIAELTAKISAAQSSAKTLADQVAYYDYQITLTNLKITQSENTISSLSGKMEQLEGKLQEKSNMLEKQIIQTYKQGNVDSLQLIFSSDDFPQFIARLKYSQIIQANNRKYLYDTQLIQSQYGQQKTIIEDSKKRLQAQKASLAVWRETKDTLLRQTKNDEATYQKLLTQAISERNALKTFALSKGGRLLPPQPSPDGWYFNQRDERWGMQCIGSTCNGSNPSRVWEVGCLITSVTMLQKKNGANITPGVIASNPGFFFQDLMLIPWPAQPGFRFTLYGGGRFDLIDSELGAGRPVVVKLIMNTQIGTHFIVLKSKNGNDYIMNDPWEGPDLPFSKYYSRGSINSVATYTKT